MINHSTPRYVRCMKPNEVISSSKDDFNDEVVANQLRAGSMLAAIKIRKVGYGYRISYEDFGEIYWPLIGERLFDEVDQATVERIFSKAAELNADNDPEVAAILAPGETQGWKCGVTKLFIKDAARFALESTLNNHRTMMAKSIQTSIRGKLARIAAQRRKAAREVIQREVLKWIHLARWRKQLMNHVQKFKDIVVRIQ